MADAGKYDNLLSQYPDRISKEQLYKICHVSKRTALAYLETGLIPCRCSGKKTRKYSIKLKDVIYFLKERDRAPDSFVTPRGWYKGRTVSQLSPTFTEEEREKIRTAFEATLAFYPDVLTVKQVAEITGYTRSAVSNWCRSGKLYHFQISGAFAIPKPIFLDFVLKDNFLYINDVAKRFLLMVDPGEVQHPTKLVSPKPKDEFACMRKHSARAPSRTRTKKAVKAE